MKTTRFAMTTALLWLATFGEAFAASSTKVYSSGILVIGFLAVCSLVVVIQLIPALMTLWGMLKGTTKQSETASTIVKN